MGEQLLGKIAYEAYMRSEYTNQDEFIYFENLSERDQRAWTASAKAIAGEKIMPRKQTIQGPYKVINIGVDGDVYEVVERISENEREHAELRPRKTYLNRQSAYGLCARLNRRWQEQRNPDEWE